MTYGRKREKSVGNPGKYIRGHVVGTVIIAYQAPGTRGPLSVATIYDPELLRRAAILAIKEAEQRAARIAGTDSTMAALQAAEVFRLRAALQILVPDLTNSVEATPVLQ
jgi:hypothetical protein